jgi:hypothetical protein
MSPQRIQLRRTKGWRKPEGAIVVARPQRWGNPFRIGDLIRDPVNSINPIPGHVYNDMEPPGVYERESFMGHKFTVTVRHVTDRADAVALFRRLMVFEGYDLSELRGHDGLPSARPVGTQSRVLHAAGSQRPRMDRQRTVGGHCRGEHLGDRARLPADHR